MKIGYLDLEPTKVSSINKTVLADGESSFEDVDNIHQGDDPDFYEIEGAPTNPVLIRKSQAAIDAILTAREQAATNYQQKHDEAKSQLTLNDLAGKTYAQVETWINSNVTNLTSQIAFNKKIAKIILAMLKRMDLSD